MLVYTDLLTGDELLSDSFPYKEIENGILWEVEGKWTTKGCVEVNIGANPSAEEGGEDEGVDDSVEKVVDIHPDTNKHHKELNIVKQLVASHNIFAK
ncbi:hypothetical protein N665_0332s0002 [Sinapis alba]|nr:hypothetical protein N665_0332s0002 [Sinapis alba]